MQSQGGRGAGPLGGVILAQFDLVPRTDAPRDRGGISFLREGAPASRLVEPPRVVPGWDAPHLVPSWDLPSVLTALEEPFEPLQSVELKFLSLKTVLLTALASVKRVGDLQAFSVDDLCLEFGPSNSHIPQTLAWICAQSSHHAL